MSGVPLSLSFTASSTGPLKMHSSAYTFNGRLRGPPQLHLAPDRARSIQDTMAEVQRQRKERELENRRSLAIAKLQRWLRGRLARLRLVGLLQEAVSSPLPEGFASMADLDHVVAQCLLRASLSPAPLKTAYFEKAVSVMANAELTPEERLPQPTSGGCAASHPACSGAPRPATRSKDDVLLLLMTSIDPSATTTHRSSAIPSLVPQVAPRPITPMLWSRIKRLVCAVQVIPVTTPSSSTSSSASAWLLNVALDRLERRIAEDATATITAAPPSAAVDWGSEVLSLWRPEHAQALYFCSSAVFEWLLTELLRGTSVGTEVAENGTSRNDAVAPLGSHLFISNVDAFMLRAMERCSKGAADVDALMRLFSRVLIMDDTFGVEHVEEPASWAHQTLSVLARLMSHIVSLPNRSEVVPLRATVTFCRALCDSAMTARGSDTPGSACDASASRAKLTFWLSTMNRLGSDALFQCVASKLFAGPYQKRLRAAACDNTGRSLTALEDYASIYAIPYFFLVDRELVTQGVDHFQIIAGLTFARQTTTPFFCDAWTRLTQPDAIAAADAARSDLDGLAGSVPLPRSSNSLCRWLRRMPRTVRLTCRCLELALAVIPIKQLAMSPQKLLFLCEVLRDMTADYYLYGPWGGLSQQGEPRDLQRGIQKVLDRLHVADELDQIMSSVWFCKIPHASMHIRSIGPDVWKECDEAMAVFRNSAENASDSDDEAPAAETVRSGATASLRTSTTALATTRPTGGSAPAGPNPPVRLLALIRECPLVVPLEVRIIIFSSLLSSLPHSGGFFDRQRVRVSRNDAFGSAFEAMGDWPASRFSEDFNFTFTSAEGAPEAGHGRGVMREAVAFICEQGFDPARGRFSATDDEHLLFPKPFPDHYIGSNHAQQFRFLGRMLGVAMKMGVLIDAPVAPFCCNAILGRRNTLNHLRQLDAMLHQSLMTLLTIDVEDLDLSFTTTVDILGDHVDIPLIPNGGKVAVTRSNVVTYVQLMAHFRLNEQIRIQCRSLWHGLSDVVNPQWLSFFDGAELRTLIQGSDANHPLDVEDWIRNSVVEQSRIAESAAHGGASSAAGERPPPAIDHFWQAVRSFTPAQQRALLRFVTSSSRAPLLGFAHMSPRFTISLMPVDATESALPSAATCFCLLKLPAYSTYARMREKVLLAVTEAVTFATA